MSDEGPWDADPQPPGWYPDPWGTDDLRWWNGFEWSDRVSPEATSDPADPDPAQRNGARLVAVLAAVALLAAALSGVIGDGSADDEPQAAQGREADEPADSSPDEPESAPAEEGAEVAAVLACTHFINVYRDARDGILTEAEVRAKLSEVEQDARRSEEPGIAEGARELLRVATQGGDLQEPSDRFVSACEDAGAFEDG